MLSKVLLLSSAIISLTVAYADVKTKKANVTAELGSEHELNVEELCRATVTIIDTGEATLGSGFMISDDGYIVTNNHVLDTENENDADVNVKLYDGTIAPAKLVGRNSDIDIALLKISSGKRLKYLTLGDSDQLRLAQPVLAIGSPLGLSNTVTSGIISNTARKDVANSIGQIGGGYCVDYIQTDVAMNAGSSGGPLIVAEGKQSGLVIGMCTAIISNWEFGVGINFAIPSNVINKTIQQLKKYGKIKHGYLGKLSFTSLTPDVLSTLGIREYSNAVCVSNIDHDSPASRAGMMKDDVILSINKISLSGQNTAKMIIPLLDVDSTVDIVVLRGNGRQTLRVQVGCDECRKELSSQKLYNDLANIQGEYIRELDMTVTNITPDLIGKLNIPYAQKGVVISNINLAYTQDINVGDLIESINLKTINDIDGLKKCLSELSFSSNNGTVVLKIIRKGETSMKAVKVFFRPLSKAQATTISKQALIQKVK